MTCRQTKLWLMALAMLPVLPSLEQSQSCPINLDFDNGTLTHWQAYTGNNQGGDGPSAIKRVYDSTQPAPGGTIGATVLPEYNLPQVTGIAVITTREADPFGGFPTIPTINGYSYRYSILLGSTSVSYGQLGNPSGPPGNPGGQTNNGNPGGYVRGVSYLIDVPPGPSTVPYVVTYAYAMVLENGTHPSLEQPMARAFISTPAGTISCASPEYYLPTSGGGLDSATALANGFTPSTTPSPNVAPNPQTPGQHLQDIWTKGWTEVNVDLSPYRGEQVSLTFEADNCVPGGHFAYAYFAIRDECAGLQISGDTIACANSIEKYSIPSLDSASYNWSLPAGWILDSGGNGTSITFTVGRQPGWVVARETNQCASLSDSLFVNLYQGALPQATIDPADTTICHGGSAPLHALITAGTSYSWISDSSGGERRNGVISSVPFAISNLTAPDKTTSYVLDIQNAGCPLTVSDTFTVTVVPLIRLELPQDTLVVANQPLQFNAISSDLYSDQYQWTPPTGLSDPGIANPVGQYGTNIDTISYLVTATDSFGCNGSAIVNVTVAHTLPDIFVPNAFTPSANSNNIFRPICMGIASLEYFRVYNRWGQLLYSTSRMGEGWDGRIQGQLQETNAYLWMLKGTDYTGKIIIKRGTVLLIR